MRILADYKNPYLEVYDHTKDEDGGEQVHEVGQVLPVEGLSQGSHLELRKNKYFSKLSAYIRCK